MKSNILQSKFLKNVFIMIGGAAGAQFIALLASPIITRLYGPEAFGVMGTFAAIANILIPVSALTYPVAIVLPREDKEAKQVITLSFYITSLISVLLLIILLVFNGFITELFNLQVVAPYIMYTPLIILFTGLLQITEQWMIRTEQFKVNAKVHFIQSIIINGSKVGIGFIHPVAGVLVFFQVISNGIRAFMMIIISKISYKNFTVIFKVKIKTLYNVARKYKDFPIYRAPEVFISSTTQNLPILILTTLMGPAAAGFYSIGRTVLALPARLIGESVGNVFYPKIVKAEQENKDVNKLLIKVTLLLILIGIIPFGTIVLYGPPLFEFVFGIGWEKAGEYARWIALTSFSIFIARPCVKSLPVFNAQKYLLFITIFTLITQTISLLIGFIIFNNDILAISLFGISGFVMNIILIILTIKISSKKN